MNEQISLNGAPVIGFGATVDQLTEEERASNRRKHMVVQAILPAGVALAGSGLGALVGSAFDRPTRGAVIGGMISNGLFGLAAAGFSGATTSGGAIPIVLIPAALALAGGAIGSAIGKPRHPTAGAVIGAAAANTLAAGALALTANRLRENQLSSSPWRRVQPQDTIKTGQRVAVVVRASREAIAKLNSEVLAAASKSPAADVVVWGMEKPPSDRWPPENTGYGATMYRFAFTAPVMGPARDLSGVSRDMDAEIWVRQT